MAADPMGKIGVGALSAADIAAWRDRRLSKVTAGTVSREMNLLSAVLSVARREWGLIPVSPISDVRRPPKPPGRDRLVTDDELARLAVSAGSDLTKATARVYHAFVFAIETAMRAGEIVGLTWDRVDLDKRVAVLPRTKNGTKRDVPLSTEAVRLLQALPPVDDDKPVFGMSDAQRDALWRKLRARAGVTELTFHDSRHTAITRLSRKLDILALARMVGHRDLRMLQIYYNETAEELAKRLD
jgi:integrase